ncbi:hypothetical protein [Pontibacter beigongshangensis]|uniref:hypothetical protein n=1 Tax=Pontibacter beigongshangensis TaxID=2574733 RepID=UPI00165088DE|nr:hypothetical protein [Pontibacter beigongshangensis]
MIISSNENKRKNDTPGEGTYVYALYLNGKAVLVGQCTDIRTMAVSKITERAVEFEKITYTFMEGVQPYSHEANLMESVARNMLIPALKEQLV